MEFKDYYKIMGVAKDATQDEIKRTYRKLARKFHPDVSKERGAEDKFKELGEAYEVLKDPEKRAAYDQAAAQWKRGEQFTPPPDWNAGFDFHRGDFGAEDLSGFSDFFETLFGRRAAGGAGGHTRRRGRGARHEAHMQGEDQHARLFISLEDAFHGATQAITLGIPEVDASGRVINKTRTLNVKIPAGIKEGQRIRLPQQGGPGVGSGAAGDLYLEVRFKPHRFFRAEGRDIYLDLPITPWEAALGGPVPVPTLAGKVELAAPAGAQAGQKLRLRGRGLPGNPPGDQYAVLSIVTPPATTPEARALYQRMAQVMPMNPRADMGV